MKYLANIYKLGIIRFVVSKCIYFLRFIYLPLYLYLYLYNSHIRNRASQNFAYYIHRTSIFAIFGTVNNK